jgi:hypothetical protein
MNTTSSTTKSNRGSVKQATIAGVAYVLTAGLHHGHIRHG